MRRWHIGLISEQKSSKLADVISLMAYLIYFNDLSKLNYISEQKELMNNKLYSSKKKKNYQIRIYVKKYSVLLIFLILLEYNASFFSKTFFLCFSSILIRTEFLVRVKNTVHNELKQMFLKWLNRSY
jgi:hypothetical protein